MIALVGAGPSLASHLNELLALNCPIATTNHTHDFLVANGINPDIAILTEASHKAHISPIEGATYYIRQDAAVVPGSENVIRYHRDWASSDFPILNVARHLGFKKFHLFGFDSSRAPDTTHVDGTFHYGQKEHKCEVEGRVFVTNKRWLKQAKAVGLYDLVDCELTVYGDSLLAAVARIRPAELKPGQGVSWTFRPIEGRAVIA